MEPSRTGQCGRVPRGPSAPHPRARGAAPAPGPPPPPLPIGLDQIFLDAPSVGRVGLQREIPLERLLGPRAVLLLIVEKPELPERIGKRRVELGGALVPLEGLLPLVG